VTARRTVAPVALIGLVALTALLSIGPALDDAYIVYRYVVRFLNGNGLTFNDHEYVEGYTSLAWTLLLATATFATGGQPHVVSVALNCVAIVLTAVSLNRLLRRLDVPEVGRYAALALLSVSFLYYRVVFIGLEFGLFALLLVAFFEQLFSGLGSEARRSRRALVAAGLLAGVVVATRPEAIVLLPAVCGALWVLGRNRPATSQLLLLAIPWLLVVAGILIWRRGYYGEWLPNSVIAKAATLSSLHDAGRLIRGGVGYLLQAYTQNPGLALIVALVGVRAVLAPSGQRDALLLLLPAAVAHAAVLPTGGDWMPYGRFVNAFTPMYVAAFFVSIGPWLRDQRRAAFGWIAVLAALYVPANLRHFEPTVTPVVGRFPGWMDLYRQAGEALGPLWVEGDILMAESIGLLGYAAPHIYLHDPLALTDRHLAHDPDAVRTVYGRRNWQYSLSLDPAVILLHHWPHQRRWNVARASYPANYSFWLIPWTANEPFRCLYGIVRKDRLPVYAAGLRQLGGRNVDRDSVSFPCAAGRDASPTPTAHSNPGRSPELLPTAKR